MYCEQCFLFKSVFKWEKIMNGRSWTWTMNYFMHFPLKLRRLKLNHSPTFDEILCYENIHLH